MATAGITNCDVPIKDSNKAGTEKQLGSRLFLVLAPFLKALQDHESDEPDNRNKCQNYKDLKSKGYEADKGDQLLKQGNDQGDNN